MHFKVFSQDFVERRSNKVITFFIQSDFLLHFKICNDFWARKCSFHFAHPLLLKGFDKSWWIKRRVNDFLKPKICHKISETNSCFRVRYCNTGKVLLLFLGTFLLVLTKLSFWQGEWTLGYHFLKFRHFANIF